MHRHGVRNEPFCLVRNRAESSRTDPLFKDVRRLISELEIFEPAMCVL